MWFDATKYHQSEHTGLEYMILHIEIKIHTK